ncbi:MAG: hypothetical protein JNM69_41995 [Archangium sp.]|nr:hypothetical protein [Archangium sp.]
MRVVELIDFPEGTLTAHGPARRYQRFPIGAFVASPTGTLRVPGQVANSDWQLVLENETPRFIGELAARLRSLDDTGDSTLFRVEMGEAIVLFRVVPEELPSLAWPAELDEVITAVAPGVAGLDVLADALLERSHPLGERLRGLKHRWSDADWSGELPLFEREARFDFGWSRGVATSAVVRSQRGLDRLSAHVATHLVQTVDLLAWSDEAPGLELVSAMLESLLRHHLPWLATLRVHGLKPAVAAELQRVWRTGRWSALVNRDCRLETPKPTKLRLVTAARADDLPERGFMQVGDGSPMSFVRLRHTTPELTVARQTFTLNGSSRTRGAGAQGPWVVPLKAKDHFTIDDRSYTIEA